jgi:hypothetical protein
MRLHFFEKSVTLQVRKKLFREEDSKTIQTGQDYFMAVASGGFGFWRAAVTADSKGELETSKSHFEVAAKSFFDEGSSTKQAVGRAYFEYSTLMDAFSAVQEGRISKSKGEYDLSLPKFERASEVFRSTLHFGFLAGYISGCASLETALEMEPGEDSFQGFKNANALFEQSKLLLSFRDEKHAIIHSIDILLKYSISRALFVESQNLAKEGAGESARKKKEQSRAVEEEFERLAGKNTARQFRINYFPDYECKRAEKGALLVSFPEQQNLWIGNVGKNLAVLNKLGSEEIMRKIASNESIIHQMQENFHGKLRIKYEDAENGGKFDEGCLTIL